MPASWWAPRAAVHNVWRVKFNALPLALLVTWHVPLDGQATVQVSIQSVYQPQVHRAVQRVALGEESIRVGETEIGPLHTRGTLGQVHWDMAIHPLVSPIGVQGDRTLAGVLPLSAHWISLPAVRFEGKLIYGDEVWRGSALGAVHHAWGNRLPGHWLWVHAARCSGQESFLEAWIVQQRLAHIPWPSWSEGYLWFYKGGKETLLVHPRQGKMTVNGLPDQFILRATPWHGTGYALYGRSHTRMWQKLGYNIINTLVGNARIPGILECPHVATIEWRNPPVR